VNQVAAAEAHVEPARVEHGAAGDVAAERRELRVQEAQRAQVHAVGHDREAAEDRERGAQDVELALRRADADGARHVGVAEDEARLREAPAVERPAERAGAPGDRPRPRVREVLPVELAQEAEVDGRRLDVHVLEHEHRAADAVRHAPDEPGAHAAHVHVAQRVLDHAQVARVVADVQPHAAAARRRQRRVDPRDVGHRDGVAAHVHVVAHGQAAPPHHLAARAPGGPRKDEAIQVEPGGVAEEAHVAGDVAEAEGRVVLDDVHAVDRDAAPRGVRVREPRAGDEVHVGPAPRAHEPLGASADLAVLAREVELHGGVAAGAAERVVRVPRHREQERAAVELGRVHDDVVAEAEPAPLRPGGLLRAVHAEDGLVVPPPRRGLLHVDPRPLHHEGAHEDAPVEDVARVEVHLHRARREEERVGRVADRERVDRDAGEEVAADAADVDLAPPLRARGELPGDEIADALAAVVGLRDARDDQHHDQPHREDRDGAADHDESAAGHGHYLRRSMQGGVSLLAAGAGRPGAVHGARLAARGRS
jgi:hypothetical protein